MRRRVCRKVDTTKPSLVKMLKRMFKLMDKITLKIFAYFSLFSLTFIFLGCTQKNRLSETVLLSTQNMFKQMGKKIIAFYANNFRLT